MGEGGIKRRRRGREGAGVGRETGEGTSMRWRRSGMTRSMALYRHCARSFFSSCRPQQSTAQGLTQSFRVASSTLSTRYRRASSSPSQSRHALNSSLLCQALL